jgi:hypothetical protein
MINLHDNALRMVARENRYSNETFPAETYPTSLPPFLDNSPPERSVRSDPELFYIVSEQTTAFINCRPAREGFYRSSALKDGPGWFAFTTAMFVHGTTTSCDAMNGEE